MNSPWAAIFDWDGVIIDSAREHERAWELLAAETGLPLPDDHFRRGFGRKNEYIIPEILGWSKDPTLIRQLSDRKETLYRQLVATNGTRLLPGSRELLAELRDRRIPAAVGSSTPRANIELHFAITGLGQYFQAVVCAEDVTRGKPDPEVFLKAAAGLQMPPARCVVFEDAIAGLQAARAGGMKTIGIATTRPLSDLVHADLTASSLADVSLAHIGALFSEIQGAACPLARPL